jgi:hypothetical protein
MTIDRPGSHADVLIGTILIAVPLSGGIGYIIGLPPPSGELLV